MLYIQEFVQSEIDREAAAIADDRERARKAEDRSAGVDDRLKKLREQVSTLQEGVSQQAARDIERERRGRESATRAKEKLLDDNARLRAEMTKAEERAASLEDRLTETRRDLDAAREKEERLRSRVKTLGSSTNRGGAERATSGGGGKERSNPKKKTRTSRSGGRVPEESKASSSSSSDGHGDDDSYSTPGAGSGGDSGGGGGGKRRRLNELEKRVQVLTAQNAALRTIVPPPTPAPSDKKTTAAITKGQGRRLGSDDASPDNNNTTIAPVSGRDLATSGNGGGGGNSGGGGTGHREAAHRAWEAEKKLRRRVEALERRLEERGVELQAAEGQAARAKDLLTRREEAGTTKEKDAALRRLKDAGQGHDGGGRAGAGSSPEVAEELRARLFLLEEENASLKRAAELELPREIDSLKHQVRALRAQLEETDDQLEEAERRAKVAVSRALDGGDSDVGGGGGILRAEEGLFHDLQAARDELSALKAVRRELEGQVLERDSVNMELRFDLEARSAETERLRRRAKELQAALRSQGVGVGSGGGGGGVAKDAAASRPAGGRFKRERDLEGVVDALKRVTDKLRGENDRLRRVAGEGGGRAEAERSARAAKKKAAIICFASFFHVQAALQEEVERLTARAKDADAAVQKLAQKQDLVNQLRRKLKARDEDLRTFQERAEDLAETKTLLSAELEAANQRLVASDREYRSSGRSRAADAAAHSAREAEDAKRAAATLRQQRMERRSAMSGGRGGDVVAADGSLRASSTGLASSGGVAAGERELRLEQENRRLREELQAFDLDFFEEIEDLKYKYSEAARKLRQYE
ncbi:unnamed protein product [Pylaiella littoralis]